MNTSITALFCCIDDFAKTFEEWEQHRLIDTGRQRLRSGKLSLSEMLFIMVVRWIRRPRPAGPARPSSASRACP